MSLLETLRARVEEKVQEALAVPGRLVVLRGVPEAALPDDVRTAMEHADTAQLIVEPVAYFMDAVVQAKRRVVLYEEYRLLRELLKTPYPTTTILSNNLYIDAYPVALPWPADVQAALLAHFSGDEADTKALLWDDTDLSAARGILERPLYGSVFAQDGRLFATYPDGPAAGSTTVDVPLFGMAKADLAASAGEPEQTLFGEADYLALVTAAEDGTLAPDVEHVLHIAEYASGQERLREYLCRLAEAAGVRFALAGAAAPEDAYVHRDDYTRILHEHWGRDRSFRTFRVYDLAALEKGEKTTREVSQEAVIAHIVEQVEACGRGELARDVFVTAPTGAGKSAMFQVPAIYLAEKEELLTIVISPLIALMRDQVRGLGDIDYPAAVTLNSDIPPALKEQVIEKVKDRTYHILYLSPETLLARSDVEQLIGDRTIGMIVIDEAHIVTTWGKQFRPDYWYLGGHIRKLRKQQIERHGRDFILATFTATAIYHGREDMYGETIESLNMIDPITYLGYVKRSDIDIQIARLAEGLGRKEYRRDKKQALEREIDAAVLQNQKTLVYFPTVALLRDFWNDLDVKGKSKDLAMYHGQLPADMKHQAYDDFKSGKRPVMLATKAFGMGIDIPDIVNVLHYAPTGNVCDYVQEIGRAARDKSIHGVARYDYDVRDFQHINQLLGISAIRKGQLVAVISKILTAFREKLRGGGLTFTKKRNAMLLDAENFSYIFGPTKDDRDSNIGRVKSALLLIQRDFERQRGYSPISVRPIPLFGRGYFCLDISVAAQLKKQYPHAVEDRDVRHGIYDIALDAIWDRPAFRSYSFPQFKYLVYTQSDKLAFNSTYPMQPAFCVNVTYKERIHAFWDLWRPLKIFFEHQTRHVVMTDEIAATLRKTGIMKTDYEAKSFAGVLFATMDAYRVPFGHAKKLYQERGQGYQLTEHVKFFFTWCERWYNELRAEAEHGTFYLVQDGDRGRCRALTLVLGLLEAMGVLTFEMNGGASSKLYIYMNQTDPLDRIVENPAGYRNRLLEDIYDRHRMSVAMLTYLYEGKFTSKQIWDSLEDYFLGIIPPAVQQKAIALRKKQPEDLNT
ncbi:DEAD/DEAH box helicase [uncultured Selenomonas sp.]|uniref:DEAD/DEAH box helicase n=1 Tax=uncultured Selenomonas sp. TaxID=159275 RepID=UPI0025F70167|nr:DEAD/DEAH box helicase [uncultured Selenomonas sp.]